MIIDTSTLATNAEKLSQCTKKNKEREQRQVVKDTQPHELVKAKTTKKNKGIFKKILHPFGSIKNRNKTLKWCEQLMIEGADRSEFKLPEEYLQNLLPKQKMRYDAFSKKLDIIAEHIRALQSQNSRHQSNNSIADNDAYESGYESGYESKGNDIDEEYLTNLSQEPCNSIKSSLQELQCEDKTFVSPVITKRDLAPRENNQNSLLEAAQKRNYKKTTTCLKNGADITVKDTSGNNILHLIVELEGKQKVESLELIADLVEQEVIPQEKLGESIKATNNNGYTPIQSMLIKKITKKRHNREEVGKNDNTIKFIAKLLELGADPYQLTLPKETYQNLNKEQLAYYQKFREKLTKIAENIVNIKDNNGNYPLHLAIDDNKKDLFEELLERGADITKQDANGNNALHYIAKLEGKKKVKYLQSILGLVEENTLKKAVNAINNDGLSPIQSSLIRKIEKAKHNIINPKSRDNTITFCVILLQNGAKPDDLKLTKQPHNKEHYRFLHKLEKIDSISPEIKKEIKIIRKDFKRKYNYLSKTKNFFKSVCDFIDPARRTRELLAITVTTTVITMVAFAFFQGQMAIGAAISIIVVAAVMCIVFTLGFSPIKKFMKNFEPFSFDKENDNHQPIEQDEMQEKNSNREENLVSSEEQELSDQSEHREIPSTQSEHGKTPYTKMDIVSGPTPFVSRPVPTNGPSPP
ncbi:MAG: hypothetical protein PG981_001513 [Wolbachia endosymbiont of Ctenocephalides orientis wCori]|nr:MAG: hypothetical protein PG981_001513 [Wolbachia endosymbiont of Ctenocephalides orientis wCori]